MNPLLPTFLGQTALAGALTRDMMRAKPVKRAASKRGQALVDSFVKRSKDLAGDKDIVKIRPVENVAPTGEQLVELANKAETPEEFAQLAQAFNTMKYASNVSDYTKTADGKYDILKGKRKPAIVNVNPNADEVYFAHELGHSASTNTAIGDAVRRARDFAKANPALAASIAMAGGLTPMIAGALTPGDDDLDEAILGSIALTSPTLIDEGLATKNALAIMEQSGQRASLGQRGRLAGGYLSYLAAPILTGSLGNAIGNQFDEDI